MSKTRWLPVVAGNIVLGLALYLPFEAIVLRYLPEKSLSFVYLLPEAILWLTFVIVILHRLLASGTWRRTRLDTPLLLFALAAALTTLANKTFSLAGLENINALLKYVPAYFIAAHVLRDGGERLPVRLTRVILGIAALEMLLGGLQILGVSGIETLLLPATVQIGGIQHASRVVAGAREIGAVYGTLGDTIHYGWFLTVALMVALARSRVVPPGQRGIYWGFSAALVVFIGFSYARILILAAVFIVLWAIFLRIRQATTRTIVLFVGILALLAGLWTTSRLMQNREFRTSLSAQQNFVQDVLSVLTVRYRQIAFQYGRLGWMIEAPPTVLFNRPLLGFGPDQPQAYEGLYAAQPNFLTFMRPISTMEDVYWVALLIYYGILGVIPWLWVLLRHYRLGRFLQRGPLSPGQRYIVWVALLYIPVMGLAQFANQAFEFRIASYYFWVFLGLLQGVSWQSRRVHS